MLIDLFNIRSHIIAKNLKEIHSLVPADLDVMIKRMAEIGYIEKESMIKISSLGWF